MKYAVEMGSVSIIYIWSLKNNGSDIRKLIGTIHKHKDGLEIA
jgi:hypothetical protein